MGHKYSYTQPSDSDECGWSTNDNNYIDPEDLRVEDMIRQDQAELEFIRQEQAELDVARQDHEELELIRQDLELARHYQAELALNHDDLELIRQDLELTRQYQAELAPNRNSVQYPPQPETEFGFPQKCYCGSRPFIATSRTANDPGRRFYTCKNVDDGECHVHKWWDVAVMEEMRAMDAQTFQLAEKVDYLTFLNDYEPQLNQIKAVHNETEQKLVRLEKLVRELDNKRSRFTNVFDYFVGLMVVILIFQGMVIIFK